MSKLLSYSSGRLSPSASTLNNLTPKYTKDGFDYPYGKFQCFTSRKTREGEIQYGSPSAQYRVKGYEHSGMCNFYCPEKILGCLYPTPAINEFHAYGAPRVIAAFHARGFSIPASLSCNSLKPVTDYIKPSDFKDYKDKGEKGEKALEDYKDAIAEGIKSSVNIPGKRADAAIVRFETASKIISSDLIRTTSLMQSKQNILMNRVALEGQGVVSDVSTRFTGMQNQHVTRMRNIAVAGGVGLLGLAFWRSR